MINFLNKARRGDEAASWTFAAINRFLIGPSGLQLPESVQIFISLTAMPTPPQRIPD
jgi:hypothetical protein